MYTVGEEGRGSGRYLLILLVQIKVNLYGEWFKSHTHAHIPRPPSALRRPPPRSLILIPFDGVSFTVTVVAAGTRGWSGNWSRVHWKFERLLRTSLARAFVPFAILLF